MQGKLAELRQEKGEHELVAATLKDADSDRKAWRLVGMKNQPVTFCKLFQVAFLRNDQSEKSSQLWKSRSRDSLKSWRRSKLP
jgi:hypothetical protein